jgi:superfamily I DNA/RNA helicase
MAKSDLDVAQLSAVLTPFQNTMVVAGAGSGKTRVLVERVAHLVETERAHPAEIMAVTFTRKAAREMRERLQVRLGHRANKVIIGTFHALALSYIKRFPEELGLRSWNLSIYGPWEEGFMLKDTARMVGHKKPITIMDAYYETGAKPNFEHPERRLFDVFTQRLRSNNAVTYGQMLVHMRALSPQIIGQHLKHVLVDEVQDMDALQWDIIVRLTVDCPHLTLFMVGDIDQSIYEWRGAKPGIMLAKAHAFEVFYLENNYRSLPAIVEAADRLIQFNHERLPKRMAAIRPRGPLMPLVLASGIDSAAAASMVSHMASLGPVTVLSRTHVLLVKLAQELAALGVEHRYCGRDSRVMQSEPFRRAHALLQLAHNQFDNFSFSLARMYLEVGDSAYLEIDAQAARDGKSQMAIWLKSYAPKEWVEWFLNARQVSLFELLDQLEGISNGLHFDLAMQLKLAVDLAKRGATLEEYLEWVATFDLQEDVDSDYQGVQLMTIHAAKGLEFPCVVLVGMNEGLLPNSQALPDRIEEERRLAYVAITRARDSLVITVRPEETTSKTGKTYTNSISRFVEELGGRYVPRP